MISQEEAKSLSEEEILKRQRKGANVTAIVVGVIALVFFLLTIYLSSNAK